MAKYYYNGVLLPEIPVDEFVNCPYLMILKYSEGNVYVYGSTSKPYYNVQSSVERLELPSGRTRSKYNVDSDVWGEANTSTASTWCNLSESWTMVWSNFDIPNGSATSTTIYFYATEPVLNYDQKYLIQSGGSMFTVTDGALVTVEGSELTAELFRTYGVDEVPSSDLLTTLTDPVVLQWTDADEINPLVAVVQGVPPVQTLESPDYNMEHSSILGIEKVLVDASDGVRFAISFDAGQTWKIHTGEAWVTLSEGDTGMSPSVLSAITTEYWNAEATTGKFRFRVTLSTVDDYVNSLAVDYLN